MVRSDKTYVWHLLGQSLQEPELVRTVHGDDAIVRSVALIEEQYKPQ